MAKKTAKKPAPKKTAFQKRAVAYQKPVQKLYKQESKQDNKTFHKAVNSFDMDDHYLSNAKDKKRIATNKKIGITNATDRIARTPTEHVYNVSGHYKKAIAGVKKNAQAMARGQKQVNQANAAETIRRATLEGASANHQNDVRYTEAKHQVANDSATTRNKLSANHAQNLNKITTNTAANIASANATKAKANDNTMENYYKFRGNTIKEMRVNRLNKRQEQKQNDQSTSAQYRQTRISAKQNRKSQKWEYKNSKRTAQYNHKQNMKKIAVNKYNTVAQGKYRDLASVNAAIKKLQGKKGVKYKREKLTTLYTIQRGFMGTAVSTAKRSSGGSSGGGGGRSGRRYYYSGGRRYYRNGGSSGYSSSSMTVGNRNNDGGNHSGNHNHRSHHKSDGGKLNLYTATQLRNRSIGKGNVRVTGNNSLYAALNGGGLRKAKSTGDKRARRLHKKNPRANWW